MHGILQFNISYEDGAYTADGVNAPIVTFGYTFEELQQNIREAVTLFFEGEKPSDLGFVQSPSILTSFELPAIVYGSKA
jgi:predicted RNase H-like HicB family nuclease